MSQPDAQPADGFGTYHVFVFEAAQPKGGLRDLVKSTTTLSLARKAVEAAASPSRQYHIVTVDPETLGLVIVESGTFTARRPLRINTDPNDPTVEPYVDPSVAGRKP